jgi:predicted nucleic acid-binding protein
MPLVYFDTCVWLSAFLTKDVNHEKAVELFQQIRSGKYIVVVTHHVLNEIIDFLKNQAAISTKDEAKAEEVTRANYKELSLVLLKLPNVLIKNPNVSTHNVLRPSFSLLFKYLRGILRSNICPICHTNFEYVEPDTISRDDALHCMLAWALNCDVFITFDKDFRKLSSDPILQPMKIEVLSS